MRVLLLFIFTFGALSFTKGQGGATSILPDSVSIEQKAPSVLGAHSSLADSASYYIGVFGMNEIWTGLGVAYDFNKDLFLLGIKETLSKGLDSVYVKVGNVRNILNQYAVELEVRREAEEQTSRKNVFQIGQEASADKDLNANSSLADSASYSLGVVITDLYQVKRSDFNPSLWQVGLRSVIYNTAINLDNAAISDIITRYLAQPEQK